MGIQLAGTTLPGDMGNPAYLLFSHEEFELVCVKNYGIDASKSLICPDL